MDLVGDLLCDRLRLNESLAPQRVRPVMSFRGTQPGKSARFFGRFVQYPRLLRRLISDFDLFHIVDHSYAHLVHELPAGRSIVTCHDLDTFRCLLEPDREPRSFAFRSMTRRILNGLQAAAHVTCDTVATCDAILRHHLIPSDRLSVVYNGVHPSLSAQPEKAADDELVGKLDREPGNGLELLHVGSTIQRKRIDVLLRVFAEVRKQYPGLKLIRVGAPLTREQEQLASSLGVLEHIDFLDHLDSRLLGACYRRASLLLQPSESEGFGLPVIEAMACGTPVIASDIPPLREIGGDAIQYCPVADFDAWSDTALRSLRRKQAEQEELRALALQRAARFTWQNYANSMFDIYQQVWSA